MSDILSQLNSRRTITKWVSVDPISCICQFQLDIIPQSTRLLQQMDNCEVIDRQQNLSLYVAIDALIAVIRTS
jgi:hypothetical protein